MELLHVSFVVISSYYRGQEAAISVLYFESARLEPEPEKSNLNILVMCFISRACFRIVPHILPIAYAFSAVYLWFVYR